MSCDLAFWKELLLLAFLCGCGLISVATAAMVFWHIARSEL